jgi:hypothetical protein
MARLWIPSLPSRYHRGNNGYATVSGLTGRGRPVSGIFHWRRAGRLIGQLFLLPPKKSALHPWSPAVLFNYPVIGYRPGQWRAIDRDTAEIFVCGTHPMYKPHIYRRISIPAVPHPCGILPRRSKQEFSAFTPRYDFGSYQYDRHDLTCHRYYPPPTIFRPDRQR